MSGANLITKRSSCAKPRTICSPIGRGLAGLRETKPLKQHNETTNGGVAMTETNPKTKLQPANRFGSEKQLVEVLP
jgi:hypothetical protein